MHEEYTLKIMITPTHIPCETCSLDCSLQEKQDCICEKLNKFNNKIIAKEYEYDKAVEIIAKVLTIANTGSKLCVEGKEVNAKEFAVAALKALLEGGK